jgi:peptide/nickel transport system permease protein
VIGALIRSLRRREHSYLVSTISILGRNRFAMVGLVVLSIVGVAGIFPSYISPYDPYEMNVNNRYLPPGFTYALGTDMFGRDTLSRVIWGARISLFVASISVIVAVSVGVIVGILAGFYGGMADEIVMRLVDGMLVLPDVFLGLVLIALLGSGVEKVMLAMGVVFTPAFARVVRASTLVEKEKDYVLAARSLGKSDRFIIVREIFPNCLAPLIVQATITFGYAVLYESFFSFLGLGVRPPTPSWGAMVSDGVQFIRTDPWLSIFPGIAILVTVLALNIFGDGLRDALDPRLRVQ